MLWYPNDIHKLEQTKPYFMPSLRISVKMAIMVFFFYLMQTIKWIFILL
ncbi:hypothetical protein PROVRETT_05960 [Providencia rettgeri DSM 1131]|nr:hypothetical protein PROVRETT_05960 [Providencia rettgeri DSM 1131]